MGSIASTVRTTLEKNWPELRAAATGGFPRFIVARHPPDLGSSVPVFCYHVVEAEQFEADLDFLCRNGHVTIDADALLDHLEKRGTAPNRAVVLTVDDGARNLYEVAFPLLKRYGMRAVAFIAPRFYREDSEDSLSRARSGLPSPLGWSQIREMHESKVIDFQSHTYEHRYVPRWPEPADLEGCAPDVVCSRRGPALTISEDFRLAKETLDEKLGKPVRHLAFPRYKGTEEALRIGRECGYKAFWWGIVPNRPDNRPGLSPSYIVRLKCDYLRRLPGEGRLPLRTILLARYRRRPLGKSLILQQPHADILGETRHY